jgi:hypothetical protein
MASDDYKFKFYTRKNKLTGRTEYQTLMMGKVDGKDINYRTSFHSSKDKAQNEINRALGLVRSSQTGTPTSVKQDYGTRSLRVGPSESVKSILSTGGMIEAPETYQDIRYVDGMQQVQERKQSGIRVGDAITRAPANMLDPNYDPITDTIPGVSNVSSPTPLARRRNRRSMQRRTLLNI